MHLARLNESRGFSVAMQKRISQKGNPGSLNESDVPRTIRLPILFATFQRYSQIFDPNRQQTKCSIIILLLLPLAQQQQCKKKTTSRNNCYNNAKRLNCFACYNQVFATAQFAYGECRETRNTCSILYNNNNPLVVELRCRCRRWQNGNNFIFLCSKKV